MWLDQTYTATRRKCAAVSVPLLAVTVRVSAVKEWGGAVDADVNVADLD